MSYYAVNVGRQPGVYESWADCHKNVNGYSGAVFKKFSTLNEARKFADVEPLTIGSITWDYSEDEEDDVENSLSHKFRNIDIKPVQSNPQNKMRTPDTDAQEVKNDLSSLLCDLQQQVTCTRELKEKNKKVIVESTNFLKDCAGNSWYTKTGTHISRNDIQKALDTLIDLTQTL